jgi:hypothetical protein
MNDRETRQSGEALDYRRLFLSVTGAVLLTAFGLWLIYWLIFWLVSHWMIWQAKHPIGSIFLFSFWTSICFLLTLSSIIQAARKQRLAQNKPPAPE